MQGLRVGKGRHSPIREGDGVGIIFGATPGGGTGRSGEKAMAKKPTDLWRRQGFRVVNASNLP